MSCRISLSDESDSFLAGSSSLCAFKGGRMLQTACGSPCYAAPEMIAGKRWGTSVAMSVASHFLRDALWWYGISEGERAECWKRIGAHSLSRYAECSTIITSFRLM